MPTTYPDLSALLPSSGLVRWRGVWLRRSFAERLDALPVPEHVHPTGSRSGHRTQADQAKLYPASPKRTSRHQAGLAIDLTPSADLDPELFGPVGVRRAPPLLSRPIADEDWHTERWLRPVAVPVEWATTILASVDPEARARWDLPTRPQDWVLQDLLHVTTDGVVGPRTLAALDARLPTLSARRLWGSSVEAEGEVLRALLS
jgi:hypothetical protein